MSDIQFVTNEPALLLNGDALVVAELHIGLETELYRSGVFIKSNTGAILKRLQALVRETGAKKLFIIGDLKHDYADVSYQEQREVPKFLDELSKIVEVHVIPGNHDGLFKRLLPAGVKWHGQAGFRYGTFYLTHGHAWPSSTACKADVLIMGHLHPAVEFRDKLGFRSVEYCWLRGRANVRALSERYRLAKDDIKLKEVVIVPPFNNLVGGMPVNRLEKEEKEISPITRQGIVRVRDCDVYLLDGTHLGKAGFIKSSSSRTRASPR